MRVLTYIFTCVHVKIYVSTHIFLLIFSAERHQNNSRKDDGNQTLGEDSKNHQNTSNKENNSREDNGNQTLGEGNDDSAHVLVHHGDQQNYHAGAAFQGVPLPTIDPHLPGIPRINEMQVSATYIHQIARCQDDQSLQSLTCKKLSEKIKKWEDKQRAEAKPRPRPKKGSENENDNPPAGTSVGRQETSTESLKKEVQDYYKKEHPDMTVQKKNKFLVAKEGLIKGKPQYLLKHNNSAAEPDGLLHIVVVKSIEPELKENDEKYHQIQTLLYAGGLVYCDYVQCSKTGDAQPAIQRILPQEDWQKTVVPKAHKYCKYFDEMWSQVKSQHHKNQLLQDM